MDQLRPLAENAVLEHRRENIDVRADRDDDVGLRHRAICARPAVAAERPQSQLVRRWKCIGRVLQTGDWNAGALGELYHLFRDVLVEYATADDEHRTFSAQEQRMSLVDLRAAAV